MMKLIGLMGKAGSGKDTVADYLCEKYDFDRYAFADELKNSIGTHIFNLSPDQLYGDKKEIVDSRYDKTPREILQLGGEYMRKIHSNIWVDVVMNKIKKMHFYMPPNEWIRAVISDVRYINEMEEIKNLGGIIIRIDRQVAGVKKGIKNHVSETALFGIIRWNGVPFPDYNINNDGTFEQLYTQVDLMMREEIP